MAVITTSIWFVATRSPAVTEAVPAVFAVAPEISESDRSFSGFSFKLVDAQDRTILRRSAGHQELSVGEDHDVITIAFADFDVQDATDVVVRSKVMWRLEEKSNALVLAVWAVECQIDESRLLANGWKSHSGSAQFDEAVMSQFRVWPQWWILER